MDRKMPDSGSKKCVSKGRSARKRPGCIRLFVCPTTGGRLEISVSPRESILGLKTALARKLKTNPNRIALTHKEKTLTSGRLADYNIPEESQLTLLPNMESGLSLHQPEKSITQALESLSETQVNDFLSGRAPLMLAIRMGENMVFLQLQLSSVDVQAQSSTTGSRSAVPGHIQQQQHPTVRPINQRAATLLSEGRLSASALAQATRCLSRKIHRLRGGVRRSPIPAHLSRDQTAMQSQRQQKASELHPQPEHHSSTPSPQMPNMTTTSTTTPLSNPNPNQISKHATPLLDNINMQHNSNSTPKTTQTPINGRNNNTSNMRNSSSLHLPTCSPLPHNFPQSSSSPSPSSCPPPSSLPSPPSSPGAVLHSLNHVGSGVYSGTFSGTLNASVQQGSGKMRRSVHTILHILNDLMSASSPVSSPVPQQQPGNHSSTASTQQHNKNQQQFVFNQSTSTSLTPPPSPKENNANGSFKEEEDKADNELLRVKMQRVQMMLAQRKEKRGLRRQSVAPYSQAMKSNTITPTAVQPQHKDAVSKSVLSSCCQENSKLSTTLLSSSSSSSSTSTSSSSSSSTAMPSGATSSSAPNSDRPTLCAHMDECGDCCNAYCNSLEQDSLVV